MILADLHTHSDNSPDGENSVIEMCENAVAKGLRYLAVTDHCEIDLYERDRYETALRQSYFDTVRAQNVFFGQLKVLTGIELGNALCDRQLAETVVARRPYDLVLGSLHHPEGIDDFAFLELDRLDTDELMNIYYDELYELTEWGCFDVLAHITYPLRYINGIYGLNMDIGRYDEKISRIFEKLIEKGKGIEINTSGLRQPYGLTMPGVRELDLFRRMGGSIVTVGSDAHTSGDIGAGIEDAFRLLREAGFDRYCIFKNRQPVYYSLDPT